MQVVDYSHFWQILTHVALSVKSHLSQSNDWKEKKNNPKHNFSLHQNKHNFGFLQCRFEYPKHDMKLLLSLNHETLLDRMQHSFPIIHCYISIQYKKKRNGQILQHYLKSLFVEVLAYASYWYLFKKIIQSKCIAASLRKIQRDRLLLPKEVRKSLITCNQQN